jgi:phosphoribosylglycinamide formyltransferase-1
MPRPLPIAVLVSGEGTTLDALAESIQGGHVPTRIVLVVADRLGTGAIDIARSRGLASLELPRTTTPDGKWEFELDAHLRELGTELVLLAGFLSILPPGFVRRWAGRIINVHPSLLPRHGGHGLYGRRVHEAVLASGDVETGASVHVVDEGVDSGRVLEQRRVAVTSEDTAATLRAKVRPQGRRRGVDAAAGFRTRSRGLEAPARRHPARCLQGVNDPPPPGHRERPRPGRARAVERARAAVVPPAREPPGTGWANSFASGVGRSGSWRSTRCRVVFGGNGVPDRARSITSRFVRAGPGDHRSRRIRVSSYGSTQAGTRATPSSRRAATR